MAFPASPSNNDVHKEGTRSFVYDSALGVWDQVKEQIDQRHENIKTKTVADFTTGNLGSGIRFPGKIASDTWGNPVEPSTIGGHVLQVWEVIWKASTSNGTSQPNVSAKITDITCTAGNILLASVSGGYCGTFNTSGRQSLGLRFTDTIENRDIYGLRARTYGVSGNYTRQVGAFQVYYVIPGIPGTAANIDIYALNRSEDSPASTQYWVGAAGDPINFRIMEVQQDG
jgi:hypothetical protein